MTFTFKTTNSQETENTTGSVVGESKPKRYKLCYVDSDTFLVRGAKFMQDDYIEVIHKASGRSKEFNTRTEFGIRSGKIISLTEEDINSNNRQDKETKRFVKWLAWQNYDREQKGLQPFSVDDFEIHDRSRLTSQHNSYEEALESSLTTFGMNIKSVKDFMDAVDYRLCISGGQGNYRDNESKTVIYKGNRQEKPIYFKEFRDEIIKQYKNKIIFANGIEAEDLLQHYAKQEEAKVGSNFNNWTICASWVDKDCNQIYIPNFNYDKMEDGWNYPSKFDCELILAAQTISGDPTDHIEGLPTLTESVTKQFGLRKANGVGKGTAEKLLQDCTTIQEMWERVIFCYQQYYGFDKEYEFKDVHGEDQCWDWLDYMQQCYVLVKMQENPNEIPDIVSYLIDIGVDYTKEVCYDVIEIDTESLVENLEVCKNTLNRLKEETKSYKSLNKQPLVDKLDNVVKLLDELEGNLSLLEK